MKQYVLYIIKCCYNIYWLLNEKQICIKINDKRIYLYFIIP